MHCARRLWETEPLGRSWERAARALTAVKGRQPPNVSVLAPIRPLTFQVNQSLTWTGRQAPLRGDETELGLSRVRAGKRLGSPGGGGAITAYGGVWGDPDVKAAGVSDTRETAPVWVLSRPGVGKEARRRFLQDSGGG